MRLGLPSGIDAIGACVDWWAEHDPGREAVVDGDQPGRRTTYAGLRARSGRFAAALSAHGVGLGDRVAMRAPPGLDSLACLIGCASLGAVWCGLDRRLTSRELAERVADLDPRIVFLDAASDVAGASTDRERPELPGRLVVDSIGPWLAACDTAAPPPVSDHDRAREPLLVVYTSGSSGKAKGALLHEAGIVAFCRQQNALWPVDPLRTLNYLPISHAGSIVDLSLPALVGGGCIVFQRKFDPVRSLRIVADEAITFWASVPSTFLLHLERPEFAATDLSSVRLIAIEGAQIPDRLASALLPIAPIATNYGMTETTSGITAMAPTRSLAELTASVGRPFADTELRIAVDGEIEVRSPRTCLGYWRQADASEAAFTADGWFRTGDLGRLDADGRLCLFGRKKEMFKSGGYNVHPAEVEAALGAHEAVAEVALVAVPHPVWGEVGVAFVVAREGVGGGLPESLAALARERLADYKRPKRIEVVAGLPRLPIGKIDRLALRTAAMRTP